MVSCPCETFAGEAHYPGQKTDRLTEICVQSRFFASLDRGMIREVDEGKLLTEWLYRRSFSTASDSPLTVVLDVELIQAIQLSDSLHLVLKEQPKWAILAEVLQEIERDVYFSPESETIRTAQYSFTRPHR